MRKLASVVVIKTCDPIPDTDRLSVATMEGKGWKVVTGRGEYSPGDYAVYFEIDSFLNPDDARYEFLKDRCLKKFVSKGGSVLRQGIRIKTCKLRGVLSQGLLMPLSQFVGEGKEIQSDERAPNRGELLNEDGTPVDDATFDEMVKDGITIAELYYIKHHDATDETEAYDERVVVMPDTDLTELLKVEHYDEVREQLTPATGCGVVSSDAYGQFPSNYMPKTDEERIQNLADWITKYADRRFEVTAKDDGSSCTMFYSPTVDAENPFGVCSRNLRMKPVTSAGVVPMMWLLAKKYLVEEKLKALYDNEGKEWALQGEAVAPGLQSNRDKYLEPEWHVFRIWDIKNQRFVSPEERREFCKKNGIPHVQVIAEQMPVFQVHKSVDEILKFAEGKTARGNEREGLVFKSSDGLEPTISWKAVSNRYLLKQED